MSAAAHAPGAAHGDVRRLVLLRHGQTAWNAEGRAQGHSDVELDAGGHAQARAVAPHVASYQPVAVWSSDLARARQSAAYVAEACGLEPAYDARLREFDLGERTGLTNAEFAARFPLQYAAFREGRWDPLPGMETTEQLASRVGAALTDVVGALGAGETAVVVSHGGAIKVGVAGLLGWSPEVAQALRHPANCGWSVLEHESGRGGVRWRLAAWNRAVPDPDFARVTPSG